MVTVPAPPTDQPPALSKFNPPSVTGEAALTVCAPLPAPVPRLAIESLTPGTPLAQFNDANQFPAAAFPLPAFPSGSGAPPCQPEVTTRGSSRMLSMYQAICVRSSSALSKFVAQIKFT